MLACATVAAMNASIAPIQPDRLTSR